MGFFSKKKNVVDLRDLPRRNLNMPHGKGFVTKDGAGFVDLTRKSRLPSEIRAEKASRTIAPSSVFSTPDSSPSSGSSSSAFSFFDSPVNNSISSNSSDSSGSDVGETLRKISMQISDLDTKLYKMEQRIEVLERKTGVGAGW